MNNLDIHKNADDEIYECLNLERPKSFFLFAGAGSGKTRSLVTALKRLREGDLKVLRRNAQRVAIITYTNTARDEIRSRLEFDESFFVSTIHSFVWELIKPYTEDIRLFLKESLQKDISDLQDKQIKAKSKTTKTYVDREVKIEIKKKRLQFLSQVRRFVYSPTGDNIGKSSLNHSEVMEIASHLISNNLLMQEILTKRFPILFIDESQDTKKDLVDAFFEVQKKFSDCFSLGMFGDTMQRIYLDGKENLGEHIPSEWAKPVKLENYRCSKRVVELINRIRLDADKQQQIAKKSSEGVVRLFVVGNSTGVDRSTNENNVVEKMAQITNDQKWLPKFGDFKILTLEHHMAAKRGGFSTFFSPLYSVDKFKTGLSDGTLSFVSFFANQVLPLLKAARQRSDFLVARIARNYSPILERNGLKNSQYPEREIERANDAVNKLLALWENEKDPTMASILATIYSSKLFEIPEILLPMAKRLAEMKDDITDDSEDRDESSDALETAFSCKFSEFELYIEYAFGRSKFDTHQGVKGLEFPRVMVILDDEDAKGNLFSYDRLLGARDLSEKDIENEQEGRDNSVDRTRRLFYVTCSRAEESLAIVAFTDNPEKIRKFVTEKKWFRDEEIVLL